MQTWPDEQIAIGVRCLFIFIYTAEGCFVPPLLVITEEADMDALLPHRALLPFRL